MDYYIESGSRVIYRDDHAARVLVVFSSPRISTSGEWEGVKLNLALS